jgi:porphobilinogen synthase (EC 4.2.1.24)
MQGLLVEALLYQSMYESAMFPAIRMRRLRKSAEIREISSETRIDVRKLIYPLFVNEKLERKKEIELMPGQFVYPLSDIENISGQIEEAGIRSVILFGIPARKDKNGSEAYSESGVVQRAVRKLKEHSSLVVITDLCLCEYTETGQCGVVAGESVDNDSTLELYARIAVSQARAGADIIAPSGMMDGQIARIRESLQDNGFKDTLILSYASKMASSLYGPFREAAESAPQVGDRKSYQLNPSNAREALRELMLDEREGADMLMVKPALTNLDIIWRARQLSLLPIGAFNVSGEYAMLKHAALAGALDYRGAVTEVMTSIFRAGADFVVTYHALEVAEWLRH